MPDISMCAVTDCPKSGQCYRHKDSGTKPCEYWRAYFVWPDDYKGPCEHFWERRKPEMTSIDNNLKCSL